jgi:hypothetical protein
VKGRAAKPGALIVRRRLAPEPEGRAGNAPLEREHHEMFQVHGVSSSWKVIALAVRQNLKHCRSSISRAGLSFIIGPCV